MQQGKTVSEVLAPFDPQAQVGLTFDYRMTPTSHALPVALQLLSEGLSEKENSFSFSTRNIGNTGSKN
jgi:hypothetical protein